MSETQINLLLAGLVTLGVYLYLLRQTRIRQKNADDAYRLIMESLERKAREEDGKSKTH